MSLAKKYVRVKKFLKSNINRNFWAFMFFLFLSAGFWLFLTLETEVETEIPVPVKIINVPKNVILTTPPPEEVRVTLKDNIRTLLLYKYATKFDTIVIDFAAYNKQSEHVSIPTASLTKRMLTQLESTTRVIEYNPDAVEYFYNYGQHKRVPVKFVGTIKADSLYTIADTTLSQKYVTVYASRKILDTLKCVYTEAISHEELDSKQTFTVPMASIKGAKIVPENISVTFNIDRMTEKSVEVNITPINVPDDKTLVTLPGKVTVKFQVGMNLYNNISANQFVVTVDYNDIPYATGKHIVPQLSKYPKGVYHMQITPQEVEFLGGE